MNLLKSIPFVSALALLQAQTPTVTLVPGPPAASEASPTFRTVVVQGSTKAINYQNKKGTTKVALAGTVLSPKANGMAKVSCDQGITHVVAKLRDLPPASSLGGHCLTYVLWGITPEGRATNLGEVALKHGKCKLEVTEGIGTFGLVVTAEPYFAVIRPSNMVVMENVVDKDGKQQVETIEAKYDMVKPEAPTVNLAGAAPAALDGKTPLDLFQARNAVRIARECGALDLAGEPLGKAEDCLKRAESTEGGDKVRIAAAREAVQHAEEARGIAVQAQEARRVAMEKKAVEDRLESARMEAVRAAEAKAEAEKVAMAAKEENERLQGRLMGQLNAVLQTRASARGLIVNMNGMLFRNGKSELSPAAREKLAKIAGILTAHKGLKIEANGYTDSTGSDAFNRTLSEKRAMATKDFLVSQGVSPDAITFKGMGPDSPIASNTTDAGRKENRRVELVVTGEGVNPHS